MPKVTIQWLTAFDVTSQEVCKVFLASMFARIPNHLPTVCGVTEPLRVAFTNSSKVCELWSQHFDWSDNSGGVDGHVGHGKYWHTCVSHTFESNLPLTDDPLALFTEASVLFKPDFACVHIFGDAAPSQENGLLQGLVSKDLQTGLPPIPWACCFGSCYINLIGRTRIESANFWKVEEISNELLYCQSVQQPGECLQPEFWQRRDEIKRQLGQEFFLDPNQPTKRAVTPSFKFLRSRTESL